MENEEKEIRGTCACGFTDKSLCICWNQEEELCQCADCEHFIPLNDFSEEAHKAAFDEGEEERKNGGEDDKE